MHRFGDAPQRCGKGALFLAAFDHRIPRFASRTLDCIVLSNALRRPAGAVVECYRRLIGVEKIVDFLRLDMHNFSVILFHITSGNLETHTER